MCESYERSILIAGVGGQGTLLASRIIGTVAINRGFDVKVSEVHGMSQRGGAVVTYVRFAQGHVYSPIIDHGCADVIIAFEQLEAYRNISCIKKNGIVLMNTQQINPMPVITGAADYPTGITEKISSIDGAGQSVRLYTIDALAAALEAGSGKAVNVVLTGLLARVLDKEHQNKNDWLDAISSIVPKKLEQVNLKAFELGFASGEKFI